MHELALDARALTKRFGKAVALDGLDLQLERGEAVALIGGPGAGKSIALRMFAGLTRPTRGSLTILGARAGTRGARSARRRIGYVRQEPAFHDWLTGREHLALAADLLAIGRDAASQIDTALAQVGLIEVADRRLAEYSPAMRQRLELGQALLGDPEVLLLDEPLGWIEPAVRPDAIALLERIRGAVTLVLATADLALAEATCDRVAVLDGGRLLSTGPTIGLLDRLAPSDYLLETISGPGLALAGLAERLRLEPWVRGVNATDGALRIAVSDEQRAEQELFATIASTGLPVRSLRRERPGVEVLIARLRGNGSSGS